MRTLLIALCALAPLATGCAGKAGGLPAPEEGFILRLDSLGRLHANAVPDAEPALAVAGFLEEFDQRRAAEAIRRVDFELFYSLEGLESTPCVPAQFRRNWEAFAAGGEQQASLPAQGVSRQSLMFDTVVRDASRAVVRVRRLATEGTGPAEEWWFSLLGRSSRWVIVRIEGHSSHEQLIDACRNGGEPPWLRRYYRRRTTISTLTPLP